MTAQLLWPDDASPEDLAAIESVPPQARGLPETTYALTWQRAVGDDHPRHGGDRQPATGRNCCTSNSHRGVTS